MEYLGFQEGEVPLAKAQIWNLESAPVQSVELQVLFESKPNYGQDAPPHVSPRPMIPRPTLSSCQGENFGKILRDHARRILVTCSPLRTVALAL